MFLINLVLTTRILRYVLLLDVLIDVCFVFTMYLINMCDTNGRYSGYCFRIIVMILLFCLFKSLISTDMTYIILAQCAVKNLIDLSIYACYMDRQHKFILYF